MDREVCCSTVHVVAKSQTQVSDWTELNWTIYMSSLDNYLFKSLNRLICSCWYWAVRLVYIFWRLIPFCCLICKYFLPFYGLSFHFVYGFDLYAHFFCLIRSHLFIFIFIFTLGDWHKLQQDFFWPKYALFMFCSKDFVVFIFNMIEKDICTPMFIAATLTITRA